MPPRRNNKSTPQVAPKASSPPPARRGSARNRSATIKKETSPTIVQSAPMDSDAVFQSKAGGRGNLKFKAAKADSITPIEIDGSDVEEVPVTKNKKKLAPVKVEKIGGRRRSPPRPRPVKPRVKPSVNRSGVESFDSDDEQVIHQNASPPSIHDEGYASRDIHDEGYASRDSDEEDPQPVPQPKKKASVKFKAWEASEEEVDDNGNLRGFIDDEAEEEDEEAEEDSMQVDAVEVDQGEEEEEVDSSPMPLKISNLSKGASKKRSQNDRSSGDEESAPRKKRSNDKGKTIQAIGHTARVELKFRKKAGNKKTTGAIIKPTGSPDFDMREGNSVHYEEQEGEEQEEEEEEEQAEGVEGADGQEGEEEAGEGEDVEMEEEEKPKKKAKKPKAPEDDGCEVTHPDKQTELLKGTYLGCPPLVHPKVVTTNDLASGNLNVLTEKEQFHADISKARLIAWFKTITVPTALITRPSRDHPKRLSLKQQGPAQLMAFSGSDGGQVADVVFDGYVIRSELRDGRTYEGKRGKMQVKEIEIILIAQEGDRAIAMLSMAGGGKNFQFPVSEDGGIVFSTKHTVVDEEGNGQEKQKLDKKFLSQTVGKSLPTSVVHKDIVRRSREGTETVPVYDCAHHFRVDKKAKPTRFVPEEVLTQRARVDKPWTKEVPLGSLVTVHSTVSVYNNKTLKAKVMSLNLSAVQIIAMPKFG
ncbi:unnamed protein product [Peniophora sp. CBMAI 1063]|nr:unnamed protein product [Peniophora sp. CBMAI 1063]